MKATGDRLLLDSSAWLSYFLEENDLSRKFIEGGSYLIMTSVLSIFEIKRKMLMRNVKESRIDVFLDFIKSRGLIIGLDEKICRNAAELSLKHKLHTVDSLIYSSAMLSNATLISGDTHFEGLHNVLILK